MMVFDLSRKNITIYYFLLLKTPYIFTFVSDFLMPYSTVKAIYSDLVLTKRGVFHNMMKIIFPPVSLVERK
jgi:hypothetical protein